MAVTVFKDASYSVTGLLSRIQHGEIALPDIQRPFSLSSSFLFRVTMSQMSLLFKPTGWSDCC